MPQPGEPRVPAVDDVQDWTVQAADAVERLVNGLRAKTTTPLTVVARALVYGLLTAVMGIATIVLVIIGLLRAVDVYLPGEVWSAHLLVGGIFTVLGGLLLRKASADRKVSRDGR
ncbi:MAG: hypothetical protein ABIS21_06445 [Acidimicrobiales bacterium]